MKEMLLSLVVILWHLAFARTENANARQTLQNESEANKPKQETLGHTLVENTDSNV